MTLSHVKGYLQTVHNSTHNSTSICIAHKLAASHCCNTWATIPPTWKRIADRT